MCPILGVLDIKTDTAELCRKVPRLSRLMRHRDPDWSGVYADGNVTPAYECLSAVDVSVGAQPLYSQQKTYVLAVNGEIYNHQALRVEYGDRYQSRTGSDCGVILALCQEKGPKFLDDLQDMLVFALYDSEKDAYLTDRDHLGATPPYMGYNEYGQLYVALEVKALMPVRRAIEEPSTGSHL